MSRSCNTWLFDHSLGSLNDLNSSWLALKELIDQHLVIALLSGQIFDCHFQLVERVLHAEQVVQIKWEIDDSLSLSLWTAIVVTTIHVRVALFFVYLHI